MTKDKQKLHDAKLEIAVRLVEIDKLREAAVADLGGDRPPFGFNDEEMRSTDKGTAYLKDNEDVVDDVFERVEHFTDRFFGRDMKELSRSFSQLAQITFDQAFQWGADPEDLARMSEILEKAVQEMKEARKEARNRRREGRETGRKRGREARRSGRPKEKAEDDEK